MLDSTSSVPFPPQLENYFTEHYNDSPSELKKFFEENGGVMKKFMEWSEVHNSTVNHIPRLYKALDIAKAINTADSGSWGFSVNKIYNYVKNTFNAPYNAPDVYSMIINPNLTERQQAMYDLFMERPDYYIDQIYEFFATDLINKEQLENALLVTSPRSGAFAVANKEVLGETYRLLAAMEKSDVARLLLSRDSGDETLMESISVSSFRHDPRVYLHLLSIIHEQNGQIPVSDNVLHAAHHYSNVLSANGLVELLPLNVFVFDPQTADWAVDKIYQGASEDTLDAYAVRTFIDFSESNEALSKRLDGSPELKFLYEKYYGG